MRALLLALVLAATAVAVAAPPASASATCPVSPLVCETMADVKCILQSPTDTYRAMSDCLGWIP